jgi:RNA polymerase sigma factor (sigma-70 family)
MAESDRSEFVAAAFEEQRGRLTAVAHRMLGSRADAEDAVQEAWLRLARQDATTIDNLAGWLTTVVGRVCIDLLRSRNSRPETPYDQPLPEWVVTEDTGSTPEGDAVLAESVGLALLVVLDTLGPAERLAFVLHDMFAVSFDEIGQILGRSSDASKVLASRARRKVQGTERPAQARQQQRAVVDAFLSAARDGDFEGLLRVLDPDVVWRSHTARGVVVRLGATEFAARAQRGTRAEISARRVLVNGEPGIVAWDNAGRPIAVMACTVIDDRLIEIESVRDPARLASMDLPVPHDHLPTAPRPSRGQAGSR